MKQRIIAYEYERGFHCIDCTAKWAAEQSLKHGGNGSVRVSGNNLIEFQVTYSDGMVPSRTIAPNPVFSDQWKKELQELFKPAFFEVVPTTTLTCGDCHEVIDEYTVESVVKA